MKLLLDAGHNASIWGHPLTAGKRSPEIPPGFYEGDFNRRVCELVAGYSKDILFLNPGPIGKNLLSRRMDINTISKLEPSILCSIHANASGNTGKWTGATGTTVFIHPSASLQSETFALLLLEKMREYTGLKSRGIKRARFAMLGVKCPAVLLETLFMDNIEDIKTDKGAIARAIYEAYIELLKK